MAEIFDVLFLFALPASGKSEVRRYLDSLAPRILRDEFHLGKTVQLDDYPYVAFMRQVSQELAKCGKDPVFFADDELPMKQPLDWLTLVELLNKDFDDLMEQKRPVPRNASRWLMNRLDAARSAVGAIPAFDYMPRRLRDALADAIMPEATRLLQKKNAGVPRSLKGKTIIIEAARGGRKGASFPLNFPQGYQSSLGRFSPDILGQASILYIRVPPKESWRKNFSRGTDLASSIAHCVPKAVMEWDYGCDDMDYLESTSGRPGTVRTPAHGELFSLPVATFDNMPDCTSFLRADPEQWPVSMVDTVHQKLMKATTQLMERQSLRNF